MQDNRRLREQLHDVEDVAEHNAHLAEEAEHLAESYAEEAGEALLLGDRCQEMERQLEELRAQLTSAEQAVTLYAEAAEEAEERAYAAEERLWKEERQLADVLHELPDPEDPIATRHLLAGSLNFALKRAQRYGHRVGLLSLQVLGVEDSPQVQKAVTQRLLGVVRDSDLLAHLGRLKYCVLLMENQGEHVKEIVRGHLAPRLKAAFAEPLVLEDRESRPGVIMAASIFPDDSLCAVGLMHRCEDQLREQLEFGSIGLL